MCKCNNPDTTFISVTPHTRCRLKLLKLERVKDYLLMEEEFIKNQERLKPQEEKQEVGTFDQLLFSYTLCLNKIGRIKHTLVNKVAFDASTVF